MFLCLPSIVRYFQCFVHGSSPSGKVVSHEPPYPSEIAAFEPPLTLGISNDLPGGGGGGGYGYFLEPHIITESMLTGKCHSPSQKS